MITILKKGSGLSAALGLAMAAASQGAAAECTYSVSNEWSNGFTAEVSVTNDGASAIDGWDVSWEYSNNRITNGWNADISGDNPYTASDLGWNGALQPGQTVSFGFQGETNGGSVEQPELEGTVCGDGGGTSSSSEASSDAGQSSSAASSEPEEAGQQCNWYGTTYSLCETTQSGWGWEDGESCIARSTCESQPEPYGVVGEDSSSSESSVASSSSSAVESSSSSAGESSSQRRHPAKAARWAAQAAPPVMRLMVTTRGSITPSPVLNGTSIRSGLKKPWASPVVRQSPATIPLYGWIALAPSLTVSV